MRRQSTGNTPVAYVVGKLVFRHPAIHNIEMFLNKIKAKLPDNVRANIRAKTATGIGRALRDLAKEIQVEWLHRASLKRASNYSESNLRLNLGCGVNTKPGWVNIDLSSAADLQLDLRRPLPFVDESVSTIYSEHFFEHLEYPGEALNLLRESLRVLKPGGLFSVGVPDTEWPIKAYAKNDEDEEYFRLARQHWHPAWCNTRMHNLNMHFRQGREHKYAYDFETLARILNEAGFASAIRRHFDPDLDSKDRKVGTLYVDAWKPDVQNV